MTHEFPVRVYYEDTDMAGIVYYANYLKFIERGRSEMIAGLGVDQLAMRDAGLVFAVRRVEADYLAAAHFGDDLIVRTEVTKLSGARMVLHQEVLRDGEAIFTAEVTIVALNEAGQPARLPAEIRQRLH